MEKNWTYKNKPITKVESLLKALKITKKELIYLIDVKQKYYFLNLINVKGKERATYKITGRLAEVQKNIREHIISKIELPSYITGGRKGFSYTFDCNIHKGKEIILKEDIKNFFPSVTFELVKKTFQYNFYFSSSVSEILAELVTFNGGLVQGSILSTDIANLVFLESEIEISKDVGSLGGDYTRYVDDITISFDKKISNKSITLLKIKIYAMLKKKGFSINRKKSEIIRPGQSKTVHGVKVNHLLKPSNKRKSNLRIELFNYSKKIDGKVELSILLSQYRRIYGLINTIKQQGDNKSTKHIDKLNYLTSLIDENMAKREIRKLRKAKDLKNLRAMYSYLKPLCMVNKKISDIMMREYNEKKKKLSVSIK
ncbi:TPA: reverse transcriptase family protein [Citrobacter werkmanii]